MDNTEEKYIYVVIRSTGEYEMRTDNPVVSFATEDAAKAYVNERKDYYDNIEKLAVRNDFCGDSDEEQYAYSYLEKEWRADLTRRLFPRFAEFNDDEVDDMELTDEEMDKLDDVDEAKDLREYMLRKGYPENVVEATVTYNIINDYDDNNPYYYYEKVKFLNK